MMKNTLKDALLNRGWGIDFINENDTYFKYVNALPASITLYTQGFTYRFTGVIDIHVQYSDIARIEDDRIVLQMGTLAI